MLLLCCIWVHTSPCAHSDHSIRGCNSSSTADLLANPELKEKFESMVAASVRAQLEQALKAGGAVNLGGGRSVMDDPRSDQAYDMRDRRRD